MIDIEGHKIGGDAQCFIIGEAGINHDGSLEKAKEMVRIAKNAGCDAVKFQLITADRLYIKDAGSFTTDFGEDFDIFDVWKNVELTKDWLPQLKQACEENNIIFMSSVFDETGADVIEPFVGIYKIASYELTHLPLLKYVAGKGKPIIMSIGGSTGIEQVRKAIETVKSAGNNQIVIMQCVAQYPAKLENANINVLDTLRKEFPEVIVGYSDHSMDPEKVPIAAVAKGAKLVEKHFTISREQAGIDHKMSLEPEELRRMSDSIRETESRMKRGEKIEIDQVLLGTGEIVIAEYQKDLMRFTRRRVFVKTPIKQGEEISSDNLIILRPGNRHIENGLNSEEFETVIGKKAVEDLAEGCMIKKGDFE